MVYVTTHPVMVDGIRLDTLAWGIETMSFDTGGLRAYDLALPGLHGVQPSMNDAREASMVSLGMLIRGTDEDGLVPEGSDAIQEVRQNLDTLLALFGKRHALLDVRQVLDPDAAGTLGQRRAWGKVVDAFAPEIFPGQYARMTVNISIPSGFWQDVDTVDWTQAAVVPGTEYTVPSLNRSTAPIVDAEMVIIGPLNDGALVDVATGHKVRLPGNLAAGFSWRVNAATWSTRVGTTATVFLGAGDAAGSDRASVTETVGPSAYLVELVPEMVAGIPQVKVKVEGTGATGATTLKLRTRRAYL